MQLLVYFETIYRPKRLRGRSPETSRLYRISIRHFSGSLGRPAELGDLVDANLEMHLQRMLDLGKAPATVNKDRAQVGAIWRFAARHGDVSTWPEVTKEIEPERIPMAWLPNELAQLLATAASQRGRIGKLHAGLWWESILRVAVDTGERISAVRDCQWNWLHDEWLMVPAEARKGKTRDRSYRLHSVTLGLLAELRAHRSNDEMFPWPYSRKYLWRRFETILKAAGLPFDRRAKFHRLRRTHATAVHAAGQNAQEAMDHADGRTTRAYIDPRVLNTPAGCDILADYLANPRRPPQQSRGVG